MNDNEWMNVQDHVTEFYRLLLREHVQVREPALPLLTLMKAATIRPQEHVAITLYLQNHALHFTEGLGELQIAMTQPGYRCYVGGQAEQPEFYETIIPVSSESHGLVHPGLHANSTETLEGLTLNADITLIGTGVSLDQAQRVVQGLQNQTRVTIQPKENEAGTPYLDFNIPTTPGTASRDARVLTGMVNKVNTALFKAYETHYYNGTAPLLGLP